MSFRVEGGLHYIRGNSAPYFSLTYWAHRAGFPNQRECGGAGHDVILRYFPQFADLAALHLSDIDGVPMHGEANGWYNLAGALGGMGERYHVGNSERHFPIPPDPATPSWRNTEYRHPTEPECLQIFADHCRIGIEEARAIAAVVALQLGPAQESHSAPPHSPADYARARACWRDYFEAMRPRFKREADACIAHHGLKVYGDPWCAVEVLRREGV